ncbi:MAG: aromatic acid exporter family protein, partial [Oscillospiraceae bacterium]
MKEQHKLPPIGARILKSAAGVALCMLVYLLRGNGGMPFYSALAVLWCMQPYSETTLDMAKQRSIGTFIGAGFGLVFLLAERLFVNPNSAAVYLCASVMIVPIIYLTVLLDKRNASFFSCVVFLSITITHSFDANPYLFVLNRVLDTFIGIAIGVLMNIPLVHR